VGAYFPFSPVPNAIRIIIRKFDTGTASTVVDIELRFKSLEEMCRSIPDFLLSGFTAWRDWKDVERYLLRLARMVENIVTESL
jgi:hypothetical protein